MSRQKLWNYNNNSYRHAFLKFELKRVVLKSLKINKTLSYIRRYLAVFYITNLPKKSSMSYSVYRCTISGRT